MTDRAPNEPPIPPTAPNQAAVQSADSVQSVAGRRRSRLAQDVPDDVVASYGAARAFLLGEWFGACVMVASFTLLYALQFGTGASTTLTYGICVGSLVLGTFVFFRSRRYYADIGFDYAPKWHAVAAVLAGSAGIFWFLFVLLVTLAWFGVPIQ